MIYLSLGTSGQLRWEKHHLWRLVSKYHFVGAKHGWSGGWDRVWWVCRWGCLLCCFVCCAWLVLARVESSLKKEWIESFGCFVCSVSCCSGFSCYLVEFVLSMGLNYCPSSPSHWTSSKTRKATPTFTTSTTFFGDCLDMHPDDSCLSNQRQSFWSLSSPSALRQLIPQAVAWSWHCSSLKLWFPESRSNHRRCCVLFPISEIWWTPGANWVSSLPLWRILLQFEVRFCSVFDAKLSIFLAKTRSIPLHLSDLNSSWLHWNDRSDPFGMTSIAKFMYSQSLTTGGHSNSLAEDTTLMNHWLPSFHLATVHWKLIYSLKTLHLSFCLSYQHLCSLIDQWQFSSKTQDLFSNQLVEKLWWLWEYCVSLLFEGRYANRQGRLWVGSCSGVRSWRLIFFGGSLNFFCLWDGSWAWWYCWWDLHVLDVRIFCATMRLLESLFDLSNFRCVSCSVSAFMCCHARLSQVDFFEFPSIAHCHDLGCISSSYATAKAHGSLHHLEKHNHADWKRCWYCMARLPAPGFVSHPLVGWLSSFFEIGSCRWRLELPLVSIMDSSRFLAGFQEQLLWLY